VEDLRAIAVHLFRTFSKHTPMGDEREEWQLRLDLQAAYGVPRDSPGCVRTELQESPRVLEADDLVKVVKLLKPGQRRYDEGRILYAWDKKFAGVVDEDTFTARFMTLLNRTKDPMATLERLKAGCEAEVQRLDQIRCESEGVSQALIWALSRAPHEAWCNVHSLSPEYYIDDRRSVADISIHYGPDTVGCQLWLDYKGGQMGAELVVGEANFGCHGIGDFGLKGVVLPAALVRDYFPDRKKCADGGRAYMTGVEVALLVQALRELFDAHGCGDGLLEHRILADYGLRSPQ